MQNTLLSEPWYLLFSNRISDAETAFLNLSDEPERLRGLGWIAYLADDIPALLRTWGRLPEIASLHWSAAAAAHTMLRRGLSRDRIQAAVANRDCSRELRWLVRDLVPTGRPWRWRARYLNGWHGIQPRRDPFLCAVSQVVKFDLEEEELWAVTAVFCPLASTFWLLCSHLALISIWLNDENVFLRESQGAFFPTNFGFRFPVQLQAGWNTLKVSTLEDFRLAASDESGAILDLLSRPIHADTEEPPAVEIAAAKVPWLCDSVDVHAADGALWKNLCLSLHRDKDAALAELQELSAHFPDSGLLAWLCVECLGGPNTYGTRRYFNIARQLPECYLAQLHGVEGDSLDELSFLASKRPDQKLSVKTGPM